MDDRDADKTSHYFARTGQNDEYETCVQHLVMAGSSAGALAASFGSLDEGLAAGLLHDIGKYSNEFQEMIRHPEKPAHVDHSTAGAQTAFRELRNINVAFAIAGHHAGLPDGGARADAPETSTLLARINRTIPDYKKWKQQIRIDQTQQILAKNMYSQMMHIRMLFSTLIDGDRLDAQFFTSDETNRVEQDALSSLIQIYGKKNLEEEHSPTYEELRHQCKKISDSIAARNEQVLRRLAVCSEKRAQTYFDKSDKSPLDIKRCKLLHDCIDKGRNSDWGSNVYTLTAPTGSGKTNASMSFALEHATTHHKSRIIYVIPYTSIIDQTVDAFEKEFGVENVLPHYGEVSYQLISEDDLDGNDLRRSLASENWNAPIVVTTAAQFFDSLYSNKTSKCRKLHSLANSVIVFDEAQTLPISYLKPCVQAIAELVANYNATAVLCTATQPALDQLFVEAFRGPGSQQPLRVDSDQSNRHIREIATFSEQERQEFARNKIEFIGEVELDDLAEELSKLSRVLCVVNTRKEAQELYEKSVEKCGAEGCFCLTTLLCAHDRLEAFKKIRQLLSEEQTCRVISTSLIEAGVDVDFPAAYREKTGLDSILQTAGRCNREGRRAAEESIVKVFSTVEGKIPLVAPNVNALDTVLRDGADVASSDTIRRYFSTLLRRKGDDALDVQEIIKLHVEGVGGSQMPFDTISRRFRLIDNPTVPIYIPLPGEGRELCDQLAAGRYSRLLFRKLGKYAVNVWPRHRDNLLNGGKLVVYGKENRKTPEEGEYYILSDLSAYDKVKGLTFADESGMGIFAS